jgi:hypothetical protein
MSELIQLVGFTLIVAASVLWFGVAAGLAAAGVALLIVGETR